MQLKCLRRAALIAGLSVMAAAVVAPNVASADDGAEAGVFSGQSTVSMNSAPTYLRSCANVPPNSGTTKINWTFNSATGARGATFDGCVWINRLAATTSTLTAEYLRANNSVITTKSISCSKNLTANPFQKCIIPTSTATFGMPTTAGLAKVRLTLRTTSPASAPSTTIVTPGSSADQDTVAMNAAPTYVRSCNNVPPNSGSTKVNWTINSTGTVSVAFDGCMWINRVGATSSRITAEFRRANNSLITTRVVNCSKNLTVNPYQKCSLAPLNLGATAGLDRVVLKLQTLNPAGAITTTTVISGD